MFITGDHVTMTEGQLIKPVVFAHPIAENGDRVDIPGTSVDQAEFNQEFGFPTGFSDPRHTPNSRSVSRVDMNGILYALSTYNYYYQYMGRNPWQEGLSYPLGARVWHDGVEYESAENDNETTPGTEEATDKWILVTTRDNLDQVIDALHDLDLRINRLEELSGGGGSGSALHEVDHLRFHRSIATGMEFPGGGVLPTAPFTTDGDFTNIPQYLYKANRIEMVGCRFSLDVGFGLEKVDGGTMSPFFNWGANAHKFNDARYYSSIGYNNTGSIAIKPRTSTPDGGYSYDVGTFVAAYNDSGGAHYLEELPDDFSDIPHTSSGAHLDRRYKWIEMAGSRGVRYVRLCDTEGNIVYSRTVAIDWKTSSGSAYGKQPYFANAKAKSDPLRSCYLGFVFGTSESRKNMLEYVRMHEIFVGYVEKNKSDNPSYCGTIDPRGKGLVKTYKFVPMSDNTGANDQSDGWGWNLYDLEHVTDPDDTTDLHENGKNLGIIASSSSYGASDIFSRRNWDGLISSLNDY